MGLQLGANSPRGITSFSFVGHHLRPGSSTSPGGLIGPEALSEPPWRRDCRCQKGAGLPQGSTVIDQFGSPAVDWPPGLPETCQVALIRIWQPPWCQERQDRNMPFGQGNGSAESIKNQPLCSLLQRPSHQLADDLEVLAVHLSLRIRVRTSCFPFWSHGQLGFIGDMPSVA